VSLADKQQKKKSLHTSCQQKHEATGVSVHGFSVAMSAASFNAPSRIYKEAN
jgi:hypothetical protein